MTKNEYFTQTLICCFMQTNVDKLGVFTDFILNLFESLVWIVFVFRGFLSDEFSPVFPQFDKIFLFCFPPFCL